MRLHSRYFIFVLGFNLLSSFGFAKANFPARGFAPVLDVEQAEDRLRQFKLSFLDYLKKVSIRHTHTGSSLLTTLKQVFQKNVMGFYPGYPHIRLLFAST